jgi:hypothetical protein
MAVWLKWFAVFICLAASVAGAQNPPAVVRPSAESLSQARLSVRSAIVTATSRYPGDSACSEMLRMLHHNLGERDATVDEATTVLASLADGRGFLALPEFAALRDKLQTYAGLLRTASEDDLEARYAENYVALERAVASGNADEAQQPFHWLAERGLAGDLQQRAVDRFALNNVVLRVSSVHGNRILPNPFKQSFRQTTDMQGTPATVTGNLVAHSTLYAPANGKRMDHAGLNVIANVDTQIAMSRNRLSIGANGRTTLYAQVLLEVRDNDFHIAGSTLTSTTAMNLGGISTKHCLGNRAINGLAGRVFDRKQGEINGQADQQIVAQGRPMMLKEVATIVEQINTGKNEVVAPIVAYGLTPRLGISSDPGGLNMSFRVATPLQLAAQVEPPEPATASHSYLAVHESAANNSGDMFAGLTMDEQRFRETVFDSLGFTPVDTEPPPGGEVPHTVTFSKNKPLVTRFFSEEVKATIRIDGLDDGMEKLVFEEPVTVNVVYRFNREAQGVVLVRQSLECECEEPHKKKAEATLGRFLVPLAQQDDITTLGQLLSIVRLKAEKPIAADGWLQMPLVER